jgi:hypothetical protein
MRRKRVVGAVVVCGLLLFTLGPFVHRGTVGPTIVSSQPENQVYVSLSCFSIGLGTTFWGDHYELGCEATENGVPIP